MFAQVIKGKTRDPRAVKAALDDWVSTQSGKAEGWLGSTGGVTDDGTVIMVARFESEEAAQRNSDRPEQGEWWAKASKVFDGEPTFDNSTEVDVDKVGDPDTAGFVQVMRGQMTNPARVRELMQQDTDVWHDFRPDMLGSVNAVHEGNRYTSVLYFTNEAEARVGEAKEIPAEMQGVMEEMGSLYTGETEYYDLKDPWLHSPK